MILNYSKKAIVKELLLLERDIVICNPELFECAELSADQHLTNLNSKKLSRLTEKELDDEFNLILEEIRHAYTRAK